MAEIKWIKFVVDIFDNDKIVEIESIPKGDTILVIWFKILTLAGKINNDGILSFTEKIPYDEIKFANKFRKNLKIIQKSLEIFQNYSMLETISIKGVEFYHIKNWEKYQSIEKLEKIREDNRKRVNKYREKLKQSNSKSNVECNVTNALHVTHSNAIEVRSKNKKEEEDKEKIKEASYQSNLDIDESIDIDKLKWLNR